MRKPMIAGNWKMNKTPAETVALVEDLKKIQVRTKADDSNKLRQNEDIRRRSADGMLQLFPNLDGMDGFFIAAAVKSGAEMRNAKS